MMFLLIIGIDGMEPSLYRRWRDELPNIRKVEEKGGFAELSAPYLPISPPSWSSFMTGKKPGKHGIIDFVRLSEDRKTVPNTGADVKGEKFFEILSDYYSIGVANIPLTYPAAELGDESFVISGMSSPEMDEDFCSSEDVREILKETGYRLEWSRPLEEGKEEESIEDIFNVLEKRKDSYIRIIKEKDPDIFTGVFTVTDRVQHWFWKYMEEDHEMHRERYEDYRDTIKDVYKEIDRAVGEILKAADAENLLIVSDHGFGKVEKGLNINTWLMEKGYLKTKKSLRTRFKRFLFDKGFTVSNVHRLIQKLGLSWLVKSTGESTRNSLINAFFLGFSDIDWERTRVFSVGNFGPLYFNDERWGGPVKDEDREKLFSEIKKKLRDIEHEGDKVIEEVRRGEEVLGQGERVPDILYRTKDGKYMASRFFEFGSTDIISETPSREMNGHHRPEGVLFGKGKNIGHVEDSNIEDIPVTVLKMAGVEAPEDMDGKPLKDVVPREKPERDITQGVDL